MNSRRTHKRNLIVSYKNLSEELLELFKEKYPEGYQDYLQRFDKPNGDTIFVVPMETEDTVYMIKFDVKIDSTFAEDEFDKDYLDESGDKGDDDFAPLQEAIDREEENSSHTERVVRHAAYEESLDEEPSKDLQKSLEMTSEELKEAFNDDEDEEIYDSYTNERVTDDNDVDDDDMEPTDEELMDIDSEIFKNAEIPPEELARMEAENAAASKTKKSAKSTAKKAAKPSSKTRK